MNNIGQTGAAASGTTTTTQGSAQGGDALDKGVNAALGKAGHGQSASTTEKISDGIRTGFKKLTGKDVPVKDKEYGQ
ncbi:uncharacterized protein JCM6883_002881 [Sporobolomyces salmoneus]|uniref:uncharacterized protein n=1 Tax=Sporobolomyces salmoneus TaxID=183962 RepID=UPI00317C1D66